MNENSEGYVHWVPMVSEDSTWQSKINAVLISSIEQFEQVISDNKDKRFTAWDTETTGLNADVDRIVGFSFAFSHSEGYYVPIRHIIGISLDPKICLDLLYQLLCSKQMVFMYNSRFDMRMMEVEGYDMSKVHYYDVQVGVFCSDTNWKKTGLKLAERRWLGWTADTFVETVGENENFSYTDASESSFYAIVDSCGTYGVCEQTIKFYKEAGVAGRVLNEVMYPFMKCEDTKIRIDKDYLQKCQIEVLEKLKDYEHEIYQEVGYQFKINSNKQLGEALQSLGINTNSYTKGGKMKVDIPTLELVNRELKSPLIDKLIEYSQLFKQYNSYILSLIKQGEEHDWKLRFHYQALSVPTGRMSAGQDRKNNYFANMNIMAIPKPHPKMWYVHDYKEGDPVPEGDFTVLRWRFSATDKSEWVTEGQDQYLNMRSAFLPQEGHYIVSCDYSMQELVHQANLANARNWVNTFNTGGDLHAVMAKQIWGEENYNKAYRKKAKSLNFGLLYGMSAYTMKDRIDESVEDTKKIIDKYWKGCPEIPAFQKAMLRKAKKDGTIYTYFHLPRRVKYWLESSDPKKRAFGERTVMNSIIQGGCATITQLALIKAYNKLYSNPEWKDDCAFHAFIHDEICSSARIERAEEFAKIMMDCMYMDLKGLPVPYRVSCSMGPAWGNQIEFVLDDNGNLVPDMEHVKE